MSRDDKMINADMPAGARDPLSYAVAARDRSVIEMVNAAVRHKQVMLAYQAVVPARNQSKPAFYEGLIRVLMKPSALSLPRILSKQLKPPKPDG